MKKSKQRFKHTLSVLVAVVMLLSVTPLGGLVGLSMNGTFSTSAAASGSLSDYIVGDIVEFGSYPQTKVTDTLTLSVLNDKDLDWKSYGYYTGNDNEGSMVQGDWMQYADTTYAGEKYRAVTFSHYRPNYTYYSLYNIINHTHQDENGYNTNTVYWYKYEPLKWRVLDPAIGLIMSENCIDSQAYSNTIYYYQYKYYNSTDYTNNPNDYVTSSIREWLNDDFYNLAFNSNEKSCIVKTTLDNTPSASTRDYVFLMSKDEMMKTEYGFSSKDYFDEARRIIPTDYAKIQGVRNYSFNGKETADWMLRTSSNSSTSVYTITYKGDFSTGNTGTTSYSTDLGIRPAIRVPNLETPVVPVKSVSVTPSELTMLSGTTYQLTATVSPFNATNQKVTWKSNYTAVATVDENGLVTAKVPGTATITAITEDRGETATCVITVPERPTSVTGISVSSTSETLSIGATKQLYASVTPSNATNKAVRWSSSNSAVATVNSTGLVTAISEGLVYITATSVDGNYRANCYVSVSKATIPVTNISISTVSSKITIGESVQLYATVSPSNATYKTVEWSSTDNSVAVVNSNGLVTGISAGTVKIFAEAGPSYDRHMTYVTITVNPPARVNGISLDTDNVTMYYNRSIRLNPYVYTVGNPQFTVKYSSSNPGVATVDSNGNVDSVGKGSATIYVTVTDTSGNSYSDSCNITVKFNFGQWLLYIICFGWIWM